MNGPDEVWRRIEAEALEQMRAELKVVESTPLEFGQFIAWVYGLYGRTDSLSSLHRVGFPKGEHTYTTCGEVIPAPVMWLVLGVGLRRSMVRCRFCETEYARVTRENAA